MPPNAFTMRSNSPAFRVFVDLKFRCSNMCAMPESPSVSLREPTL